jgi:hypothetical protein
MMWKILLTNDYYQRQNHIIIFSNKDIFMPILFLITNKDILIVNRLIS